MGRPRPRTEALQLEQECGGSGWWAVSVDSLCRGSYYVYEVGLAEDVAAAAAIATATVVAVAVAVAAAASSSSRRRRRRLPLLLWQRMRHAAGGRF